MLDRTRIYATDMDADVLARARGGRLRAGQGPRLHAQLPRGRRRRRPSATTTPSSGDRAVFDPALLRAGRLRPAQPGHRPLVQRVPRSILCRNVLIYFGRDLQDRVLRLFDESLPRRGVLALGRKETLRGHRDRGPLRAVRSKLRGSTGGHDRLRARRHRRLLGRPARRRRDPRGPARGLPAPPCSSSSTAPRTPTTCSPGCWTAAARCPCARSRTRQPLRGAGVLVAPAGYHVLVERDHFALSTEAHGALQPPVDRRRARDRRRRARARARSASCLTGANDDGAAGLAAVRRRGGIAIVQNPATASSRRCRRRRARPRPQVVAELAGDRRRCSCA